MKTKKLLYILPFLCAACSGDGGRSAVEGSISSASDEMLYLDQLGLSAAVTTVDSVKVAADGSFRLRGSVQTEPTFYVVRTANGKSLTVLLDSAQTLSLTLDNSKSLLAESASFTASPRNENLRDLQLGASALLAGIKRGGAPDSLRQAIADYKELIRSQVFADPQSMVGYFAVLQTVMGSRVFDVMDKQDHQLMSAVATSLNIAYPQSEQVQYLCNYVLQARAQQRAAAKRDSLLMTATQANSPDLTLPTINGDEVSLSSLHGKTTILAFWASDDQNSRAMNRQLRKLYDKYHAKGLEIFSVSFDVSKILWEAASTNDGIKWVNTCDLNGMNSVAARLYNVRTVPSNYILSPDGTLIGKDLFGTRLDEKIAELIK